MGVGPRGPRGRFLEDARALEVCFGRHEHPHAIDAMRPSRRAPTPAACRTRDFPRRWFSTPGSTTRRWTTSSASGREAGRAASTGPSSRTGGPRRPRGSTICRRCRASPWSASTRPGAGRSSGGRRIGGCIHGGGRVSRVREPVYFVLRSCVDDALGAPAHSPALRAGSLRC